MLLDENTGGELLSLLAERDPLPQWNEPTLGTTTLKPDRSESRTLEIPVQRHGPDAHDVGENRAPRHHPSPTPEDSYRCGAGEPASRLAAEKNSPPCAGFRNLSSGQTRSAEDNRASSDSR
jgi:hypothetical protein